MLGSIAEIFALLKETGARLPGLLAVASPGGYVTYDRFVANLERSVVELTRRGIRPGQLVVVAVANPDVSVVVALALMWVGCRVGYNRDMALYDASGVSVDAVIVDRPATGAKTLIQVTPDWFTGDAAAGELPPVAADCSIISASSGSTGRPKLVETGTKAFLRRLNVAKGDFERRPRERMLSLQGDRGIGTLCESLVTHLTGGMVIRPRDRRPATVLETIQLYHPDYVTIAPSAIVDLLATLDERPMRLGKVRRLRSSGAYFAPGLQSAVLARIAEEVFSFYGCTETGWVALGASAELQQVTGSVGRVVTDVEVAAFDSDGRRLADGSEGAIRVRIPGGCMGTYLEADPAPDNPVRDGWFVTGDIGLVDRDRNLIIRGRASNVINFGGNKVSPEELEDCLRGRAGVVDVGVAGVAGAQGYDRIGAAIVADGALTIEAVNDHLHSNGVRRSVQVLRLVAALPRTETGKIDRPALRRLFGA